MKPGSSIFFDLDGTLCDPREGIVRSIQYDSAGSSQGYRLGLAAKGSTAFLAVPSAIIPEERNYLLNPAHRDFKQIRIGSPMPFHFDPRMWK